MLHAIPDDADARFGILVPKRLAKRAVDRNTLKRLVREACRAHLVNYRGQVLVRLTKPVGQIGHSQRADWWKELHQLLDCLSQHAP
ncbi:ribonuclease P protein component [Limnobacter humi]|uniref:ribonuclease P protein component n=1 Tax=Limnobacter humi TaxID=1778671 RepID=UPI00351C3602